MKLAAMLGLLAAACILVFERSTGRRPALRDLNYVHMSCAETGLYNVLAFLWVTEVMTLWCTVLELTKISGGFEPPLPYIKSLFRRRTNTHTQIYCIWQPEGWINIKHNKNKNYIIIQQQKI